MLRIFQFGGWHEHYKTEVRKVRNLGEIVNSLMTATYMVGRVLRWSLSVPGPGVCTFILISPNKYLDIAAKGFC